MTKEAITYNGEKTVNDIRKTGQYMQKNQTGLISHTIYKNKLKMD